MNLKEVGKLGEQRYRNKRACGVSRVRRDGSLCDPETDRQSTAAEKFAADHFGVPFDDKILDGGDGGPDLKLPIVLPSGDIKYTAANVKWLGKAYGKSRLTGHLIVNVDEPQRWAELYVSARGSIESGFELMGWIEHEHLIKQLRKDFGFGLKYAMPVEELRPISELMKRMSK
jgi:hypothetical protein